MNIFLLFWFTSNNIMKKRILRIHCEHINNSRCSTLLSRCDIIVDVRNRWQKPSQVNNKLCLSWIQWFSSATLLRINSSWNAIFFNTFRDLRLYNYFVIFDRQIIFSSTKHKNLVYFFFLLLSSWLWSKCAWCWCCRSGFLFLNFCYHCSHIW